MNRRDFFRGLLGAGVACVLPGVVEPATIPTASTEDGVTVVPGCTVITVPGDTFAQGTGYAWTGTAGWRSDACASVQLATTPKFSCCDETWHD